MRRTPTIAGCVTVLALIATPAFALPGQVPSNPGTAHIPDNSGTQRAPSSPGQPTDPGSQSGGASDQGTAHKPATPGPNASAKSKGRAYGKYCADQSKKHASGEKGTPFSRCVTAMAKLASDQTDNPRTACKTMSKKHVDGEKGTPFSRCVSAGAKLQHTQNQQS